jgi:5-methylcytosine-specific restriction endonuclease McrA
LEVHHADGNPGNNAPGNLATLCKSCHIDVHRPPMAPEVADWQRLIDAT